MVKNTIKECRQYIKITKLGRSVLRSDLKKDTESSSLTSSGRLTQLCMAPSQDTLQHAGRKETRTGGRVSQFVQFSGHHFSSWRAGAVIHLTEVRAMPGGQKLHREAHLHTCIFTHTPHTHTRTPGRLSKNSDIPSVLWKLV